MKEIGWIHAIIFPSSNTSTHAIILVCSISSNAILQILADTAAALGTFVGGKVGGGVISVLLDGPTEGLLLNENGYPASELLWYSIS